MLILSVVPVLSPRMAQLGQLAAREMAHRPQGSQSRSVQVDACLFLLAACCLVEMQDSSAANTDILHLQAASPLNSSETWSSQTTTRLTIPGELECSPFFLVDSADMLTTSSRHHNHNHILAFSTLSTTSIVILSLHSS